MRDLLQEGRRIYATFKQKMNESDAQTSGVINMDTEDMKKADRNVKTIMANLQTYVRKNKLKNTTIERPVNGRIEIPLSGDYIGYNTWIPITFDGIKYVFHIYIDGDSFKHYLSFVSKEKSTEPLSDSGPVLKRIDITNTMANVGDEIFGFLKNRSNWLFPPKPQMTP